MSVPVQQLVLRNEIFQREISSTDNEWQCSSQVIEIGEHRKKPSEGENGKQIHTEPVFLSVLS